jgi:4-amino-4-deoxy-L-arabinose transferase-like glycosyltransferase
MNRARDALGRLGKWGRGRLRIGASTTACTYILPTVLREFKESFSHYAITMAPALVIIAITYVLLARVFRSLLLPLKAIFSISNVGSHSGSRRGSALRSPKFPYR